MRAEERFANGRILMVVAHPDDDTVGAGGQLPLWNGRVHILYATDGVPRDMSDANRSGFASGEAYALARREELAAALSLAGLNLDCCTFGGLIDQESHRALPHLTALVAHEVEWFKPDWVITHAYEGGHPDHDSCAFACAAAGAPGLHEFPAYRAGGPEGWILGEFIDDRGPVYVSDLDAERRALKKKMFESYASQKAVLQYFGVEREVFRAAPSYDFSKPPHEGRLHYESLGWKVDGAGWRRAAAEAMGAAHHT